MGRAFEYRKAAKFARWDRMAKAFTRAGKEIALAIKSGGANPDTNANLRRAIQNAKSAQMPKDRIEAAIKRATAKDATGFSEVVYEAMGPHGTAIVIETATDNPTRTVANLRAILNKNGGSMGTQGMHDFIFERKGVFKINAANLDMDELELELIDAGLDSLEKNEEEQYVLYTKFADFGSMQKALEDKGLEVLSAELQRIPSIGKELNEEQTDEVLELIDKLEQDDDVQTVFHNLA
ncbi:MAG TPA: YebC/PmpR family DNA-binding transcriptional regulator [Chitinophagales bacterium]|jgi:YebC/PmpR family DNA-binding regulatory protein|nr:YebC/PmpR family DNA-binding transcriptional regulator [Chitinophagales bacterium]HQD12042.1 YebC/PmpR family DNA-binding transcriptional regulator [Chitinophagales bacterium]HQO32395.1 YebC/PmpR family DNA-binding transcriptional regulator [Chitinophagales bacterium]HQO90006.1 YebC/PmpR family DNA-binding transcriptional regulator [Chitinophagales bacterium]